MDAETLKALQAPIKQQYRDTPDSAVITLKAEGTVGAEGVTCKVDTGRALVEAGLHPAAGGDGMSACSGDMLLEALVACAGVTLRAVATALNVELRGGTVRAEGIWISGDAWHREGCAGRVPVDPADVRPGYRCRRRATCQSAEADGTVLRDLSDAP